MNLRRRKIRELIIRVPLSGVFWLAFLLVPHLVSAAPHPAGLHYELALDADWPVCPKIARLYNGFLVQQERDWRGHSGDLTNFEVTRGSAFSRIGLMSPPQIGKIHDSKFYQVLLGTTGEARVLALKDSYRGNSPFTSIAIFRKGIEPRVGEGIDTLGPFLPYRLEDVDRIVSLQELIHQQAKTTDFTAAYLLIKWPAFEKLFSRWRKQTHELGNVRPKYVPPALPALGGAATIRPFQMVDGSLYFIIDDYLSMYEAATLTRTSNATSEIVVARLGEDRLDDICYLVLAPSNLAGTLDQVK